MERIIHPINLELFAPKAGWLVKGNTKIDKGIGIFNLPRGKTCPGRTPLCSKACYIIRAETAYPDYVDKDTGEEMQGLRSSTEKRLRLSQHPDFIEIISDEISRRHSIKDIRIHSSGDFYSQKYLDDWFEIALRNPDRNFMAYTKSWELDFGARPENFHLLWSLDPSSNQEVVELGRELIKADIFSGFSSFGWQSTRDAPRSAKRILKCPGHCGRPQGLCMWCYDGQGDLLLPVHGVKKTLKYEIYAMGDERPSP